MITKKVSKKETKNGKIKQIKNLLNYIRNPDITNPEEKILYHGSRGFLSEEHSVQCSEMFALALSKPKSKMPVNHYIFSWKEGEQPTGKQIEELIDIFQKETQLTNHQTVYGLHHNTENIHLHIAVNRINLETNNVDQINNRFDIEVLHKIVAKAEFLQGWKSEDNSRYSCDENGEILRANSDRINKNINQKAVNFEINSGEKSSIRIAHEIALPILNSVQNWSELHENLEKINIKFTKKGSGAILLVDGFPIKASSISRSTSLQNMEKRLGKFEEKQTHSPQVKSNNINFLDTNLTIMKEADYGIEQQLIYGIRKSRGSTRSAEKFGNEFANEFGGGFREAGNHTSSDNAKRHESSTPSGLYHHGFRGRNAEQSIEGNPNISPRFVYALPQRFVAYCIPKKRQSRQRIKQRRRSKRLESVLHGDERLHNQPYNFLRWSGTARAVSDTNINEWFIYQNHKRIHNLQKEYKKIRNNLLGKYQKNDAKRVANSKINYQKNIFKNLPKKNVNLNIQKKLPCFEDWLIQYNKKQKANQWRYERNHNLIINSITKNTKKVLDFSYIDFEKIMLDLKNNNWKQIKLEGSDTFKKCACIAACKLGFKIENLELKEIVNEEFKNNKKDTSTMNEVINFRKYHEAVDADKYRVTCMKITEQNEKRAFILDKQYGENGFTHSQFESRIHEMVKIQSRGDNIYITPLSQQKHHILIDDMNPEKLQIFLKDGYEPAIILKSSPNNFQAILTIDKLDSIHDKDVGNRITERLNRKYGDPNLSGCIHPHRVPGFLNHKQKHKRNDGTYPEVQLLHTEKIKCSKATEFAKEINKEYILMAHSKEKTQRQNMEKSRIFASAGSSHTAYFLHLENIKKHLDITDKSRVDSMIALRLRATGHSEQSIKDSICECAPTWRDASERKNWDNYATRTAAYAFSFAGDRDLERNNKYVEHWMKLEGMVEESNNSIKSTKPRFKV